MALSGFCNDFNDRVVLGEKCEASVCESEFTRSQYTEKYVRFAPFPFIFAFWIVNSLITFLNESSSNIEYIIEDSVAVVASLRYVLQV